MTALTDEVVFGIMAGPYLLLGVVAGYVFRIRRRIKRLERRWDIEDTQWRRK